MTETKQKPEAGDALNDEEKLQRGIATGSIVCAALATEVIEGLMKLDMKAAVKATQNLMKLVSVLDFLVCLSKQRDEAVSKPDAKPGREATSGAGDDWTKWISTPPSSVN